MNSSRTARIYSNNVYMLMAILSYLVAGINMYRLQPVLTTFMAYLGIEEDVAGVFMSINTMVCLICTIPVGILVGRIGSTRGFQIGTLAEIIGSVLATLSPGYYGIFGAHIFFGLANTMFTVCAPVFLQLVLTDREYAMRVGYVNAGNTVGQGICFLLLPALTQKLGLVSIWSWLIVPAIAFFVSALIIMNKPAEDELTRRTVSRRAPAESAGEGTEVYEEKPALLNGKLWVMAFGIFIVMLSSGVALNYSAIYLEKVKGFSQATASAITTTCAFSGMLASASAGPLGAKIGRRRLFLIMVFVCALLRLLPVVCNDIVSLTIVTFGQGLPAAAVVTGIGMAPILCKNPKYRPMAVSMLSTASMGGIALSSVIFGSMIKAFGYNTSWLIFIPITLLGVFGAKSVYEPEEEA